MHSTTTLSALLLALTLHLASASPASPSATFPNFNLPAGPPTTVVSSLIGGGVLSTAVSVPPTTAVTPVPITSIFTARDATSSHASGSESKTATVKGSGSDSVTSATASASASASGSPSASGSVVPVSGTTTAAPSASSSSAAGERAGAGLLAVAAGVAFFL